MAIKAHGSRTPSSVALTYQLLRNTTSPDETATGVKSFVANLPVFEILKLGTKENLRNYIAEYNPKRRNRVHDAIRTTIQTEPERFITRNSGFVIGATGIVVDDAKKVVRLTDPSILNGAQSQGEIRRWVQETYGNDYPTDPDDTPFYVRAEIVVEPDADEVVETAIARNTATPVKSISQAGARGHLDELEASIRNVLPHIRIRKSETDEDVFDTRKILQYARLLMPVEVSKRGSSAEQLRAYKNPEQCLTDFSGWFENRKANGEDAARYSFTVQIAPYAIQEYEYWESHEEWNGHHIWEETKKGGRACRRDSSGKIYWVSPGLIFPILGAMSEFVVEAESGLWAIKKPRLFKPSEMIARAVSQFRAVNGDPMQMGRSAAAYDALRIYPSTLVEVMRELGSDSKR
ncbi:AIPR family protein [Stutzerimonas nitrititolerans]|uniref:AIPR family protein n=1 Tax=Stutzerimonas nitrititolerans TaxID=2482751 RepID=UPI00289743B4|nr:AIPR family protein [Stutzerimonas nitrititolerans]